MPDDIPEPSPAPRTPAAAVASSCLGILAAWMAAGSIGAVVDPLRTVLAFSAVASAAVLSWPLQRPSGWWLVAWAGAAAFPALVAAPPAYALLLVAAAMALLATTADAASRHALRATANAVFVLAVFRVACAASATVWLAADRCGRVLGAGAGWLVGQPLSVGLTYAGVDFLVLGVALLFSLADFRLQIRQQWTRAAFAVAAVAGVHLLYLVFVAEALTLAALLPEPVKPTFEHPYVPPAWDWSAAVGPWLPWNLPALGAVLHVAVAAGLLRWAQRTPAENAPTASSGESTWPTRLLTIAPLVLAAVVPVVSSLTWARTDLSGRRIVAYRGGHLDWQRPQHDRYGQTSAGTFGMLPAFVESLGGQFHVSADLSASDLQTADALLLLHPDGSLAEPLRTSILRYVRDGGALLVAAEPHDEPGGLRNAAQSVLTGTAIEVRSDVAVSIPGHWQQAIEPLQHPLGSEPGLRRDVLWDDAGSSLQVRWPARPLFVGRWGWSDPGGDALVTGTPRFEAGEHLGDVILAAERALGRGTVVVLANSRCLTNEGLVQGYSLTGRLLAHLANRRSSPQAFWRQCLACVLCVGLAVLGLRSHSARQLAVVSLLLAVSGVVCQSLSHRSTRVVPDGRIAPPADLGAKSNLAYVDAAHVGPYSAAPWVFDGLNGLTLSLMRSGFLTVTLPELTRERLARAAILVSIAPARRFTAEERRAVREFVQAGGVFVGTVGAEEAAASAPLLREFGLPVPASPVPATGTQREPAPVGRVRSLYLDAKDYGAGDYRVGVSFHAGWPVDVQAGDAEVLVRATDDQPIVVARRVGRGRVVVIADTDFALNKNLEYIGGEPFESGGYENAHFWRWLISRVTDRPEWIPPPNAAPADGAANPEAQP